MSSSPTKSNIETSAFEENTGTEADLVIFPADFANYPCDEIMIIRAGTKATAQRDCTAPEDRLTSRSDFIRSAMKDHWSNSKTWIIELEDVEPGTFAGYLHLIYTDNIEAKPAMAIS